MASVTLDPVKLTTSDITLCKAPQERLGDKRATEDSREKLAWEPIIKSSTNIGATVCSWKGFSALAGLSGVLAVLSFAPSCSQAETPPLTKICFSLVFASRNLPSTPRDDRASAYRHLKKLLRWLLLKCLSNTCEDLNLMLLNPGKKVGYNGAYLYFQLYGSRPWRIPG